MAVITAILLAVAAYALKYWLHARQYEDTDDAFIDGSIVQVSSRVAGQIQSVEVADNQDVAAGTVLARIDPRDIQARLDQARAALAWAQADITAAQAEATRRQADLGRYQALDPRVVSQQQLDAAKAAADAGAANLTAARKRAAFAESTVAAAELDLSYTVIRAPVAGRITRKTARVGQYVQVGQIITSLVEPEVWVTANYKETQLTHMNAGQDVEIVVDAYPGHVFHGAVDSIQSGSGARFSLLPPENATGNYVKVVQRVPVKILLDREAHTQWLLAPGMSVVPSVRVGAANREHPLPMQLRLQPATQRAN